MVSNATVMIVATTPPQTPPAIAPTLGFLLAVGGSADELGAAADDAEANLLDAEATALSESDDAMIG